jgi:hypothetical protein
MWEQTNGPDLCEVNKKTQRRSFNLEIMFYGFLKEKNYTWTNSRKNGLVHSRYINAYLIILFFLFLVTILNQV